MTDIEQHASLSPSVGDGRLRIRRSEPGIVQQDEPDVGRNAILRGEGAHHVLARDDHRMPDRLDRAVAFQLGFETDRAVLGIWTLLSNARSALIGSS